ncbi:hypothetical protein C0992_009831, partial [Termitomyces sp. T32_za158]
MTPVAELWEFICVVDQEDAILQPLVPVAVSPESTVSKLVREVQKYVHFTSYPRLWKTVTSISALLKEPEIQTLVANLSLQEPDEPLREDNDALYLNSAESISTYWKSKPEAQHIHVILRDRVQQQ